jgi:predicted nucleotidyltransferase
MNTVEIKNPPVKDKEGLINLLQANASTILNYGVERLGIFGSFARNEMDEQSDIDFLVDFKPEEKTFDNFMNLAFLLEDLCGRKIELVTPQGLSKYIGPKILKTTEYVLFAN